MINRVSAITYTTQKADTCSVCSTDIVPGDKILSLLSEGTPTWKSHVECDNLSQYFNQSDLFPDPTDYTASYLWFMECVYAMYSSELGKEAGNYEEALEYAKSRVQQ